VWLGWWWWGCHSDSDAEAGREHGGCQCVEGGHGEGRNNVGRRLTVTEPGRGAGGNAARAICNATRQ